MVHKIIFRFVCVLFPLSLTAFSETYPIVVSGPNEIYSGQCYDFQVSSRAGADPLNSVSWRLYAINSCKSYPLLNNPIVANTNFSSCSTSISDLTMKEHCPFWFAAIATKGSSSGFSNPYNTLSAVYFSHFKSSECTGSYDPLIVTYFMSRPILVKDQESILEAKFNNDKGNSTRPLFWLWSLGCLSTDGLKMTMASDTLLGGNQSEWRITPTLDTNLIWPKDSLGRVLVFVGVRVLYSDSTIHDVETTLFMDPGTTRIKSNIFSYHENSGSLLKVFINHNGNVRILFPSVQEQGASFAIFDSRGKLFKRWSGNQLTGRQEMVFAHTGETGLYLAILRTPKGQNQIVRWVSP